MAQHQVFKALSCWWANIPEVDEHTIYYCKWIESYSNRRPSMVQDLVQSAGSILLVVVWLCHSNIVHIVVLASHLSSALYGFLKLFAPSCFVLFFLDDLGHLVFSKLQWVGCTKKKLVGIRLSSPKLQGNHMLNFFASVKYTLSTPPTKNQQLAD